MNNIVENDRPDSKVLFPHTSARFLDEDRGYKKLLRLVVRVFDWYQVTDQFIEIEVINAEITRPNQVAHEARSYKLVKERVYQEMNQELANYELQCLTPYYLPEPIENTVRDISRWSPSLVAEPTWIQVESVSSDFCELKHRPAGLVFLIDSEGHKFALNPGAIRAWRMKDKRTGEYKNLVWR